MGTPRSFLMGTPQRLIKYLMWIWWMLAAWLALASLLVFPLLKDLPIGVLPVVLGISMAVGLRKLHPSSLNLLNTAIYEREGRSWIFCVCLLGLVVRVPIM